VQKIGWSGKLLRIKSSDSIIHILPLLTVPDPVDGCPSDGWPTLVT
jgi:hypothetical protein